MRGRFSAKSTHSIPSVPIDVLAAIGRLGTDARVLLVLGLRIAHHREAYR